MPDAARRSRWAERPPRRDVSRPGVLHDATELSVTEAAQRGVARLVADAEQGTDLVVTRRHQPVAAVVSIRRLNELEEAAADLRDLALVLARSVADTGDGSRLACGPVDLHGGDGP
ncbi:type II toxin-antitoxin system Phd/YefM family antitoxin [Nonomuraea sp. NPDC050022]|uniref:type II toxin-antitoxin system Phd/YefM family antitoxin n=1 Tax=unclassified Nonomuraea TaxID=2593643 RepID=UPI0033E4FB25